MATRSAASAGPPAAAATAARGGESGASGSHVAPIPPWTETAREAVQRLARDEPERGRRERQLGLSLPAETV